MPRNKLPTHTVDDKGGSCQRERSHRKCVQEVWAALPREAPPQSSRKRHDDHDSAQIGPHLFPPSSRVQWLQTRGHTPRREGGRHPADVWPPTPPRRKAVGAAREPLLKLRKEASFPG